MAEPIVRKFVIDTDQSEQNLKELNTQINATSTAVTQGADSLNKVAAAEENVSASSKSLKAQLRELQAQLANTAPDSAKYRELSQAAGELKDKIQDAAQAVGTQAGGAFERVGGSLGLVTSRIANLDFEGAAEGAKLLAKNISEVKPGDIANGIKGIGNAFASVGKALLTNPIFLIGAAIAAAIVYADELLSLVDGVTDAEKEALDQQKERASLAKEQVDNIGAQEESLKRQGKTEKEILQLKLDALNAAILEQQIVVETSKTQAKSQIEAAERNYKYLKGFLDFVTLPQRKLVEFFFNFYNGAVDILNKLGLGLEQVDVTQITAGFDKANEIIAKTLFDPEETKKQGEATIKEAEKTLVQLTNQRDGLLNAQEAKEKAARQKASDDKINAAQKEADELKKIKDKELADELARIEKEKQARIKANEDRISQEDAQFALLQELTLSNQQKEIQAAVKLAEERLKIAGDDANLQKLIAENRDKTITEIVAKYTKEQDDLKKGSKETEQQDAAQRIANEQAVQNAKLQATSDALGAINGLVAAFGKGDEKRAKAAFKIQKAVSIAQATVDTYKGANAIFASAAANPATVLFPAQPFIAAGVAIASGLANVATIAQQQFQGGTSPGASNETAPNLPGDTGGGTQPAQFNPLAASFLQNREEQITPRAYVLASDVASAAETRENVADLARLG
jgi:hypothetical protein